MPTPSGPFNDKPRDAAVPTTVLAKQAADFSTNSGLESASILARAPPQASDTYMSLHYRPGDEMALAALATTPSYYGTGTATSASVPASVILQLPVTPRVCSTLAVTTSVGVLRAVYPTHAAKVSSIFQRWRGSMKYKVYVVCSAFHCMRVRVAFVPSADGTLSNPTDTFLESCPNRVYDISGPTDLEFTIPFLFPRATAAESIGQLVITVIIPPGEIGDIAGTPVFFNLYLAMGPDAEFFEPGRALMAPIGTVARNY